MTNFYYEELANLNKVCPETVEIFASALRARRLTQKHLELLEESKRDSNSNYYFVPGLAQKDLENGVTISTLEEKLQRINTRCWGILRALNKEYKSLTGRYFMKYIPEGEEKNVLDMLEDVI